MRLSLFLLPLCFLPLASSAAADPDMEVKLQQLKDIGVLPEDKLAYRPEEKLDPKRPNPFAERAKAKQAAAVETVETEEIKIRRIFDGLKITGITKSKGKYSALLGDLILEEGAQISPVIQQQTQILRVTRVTDKLVEISWVEGAGYETVAPRKIVKRVELDPRVGVVLAAQPTGTTDPNAMTYLDMNGKVVWPKQMAPNLDGMMNTLPPTSTAALSQAEEANLMHPDAPAPEPPPVPAPAVDPASALEDPVEPMTDSDIPNNTSPSGN